VLKGHAEPLISLAFTADGKQLTSVSFEGTMLHWDAGTGELLRARPKHIGPVLTTGFNVAFRPDGQRFASADDTTVKVWDVATGQEKAKITPQFLATPPLTLAYSADGRRLAAAVWDAIKVWDAETGAELHRFGGPNQMVIGWRFVPTASSSPRQAGMAW
jgi:WD40 repeat protein